MRHQIIQRNKFCLSKYLWIENQVQGEEETMWKVYKLILVQALEQCPAGKLIFRDHYYINYFKGS